jgi:hypothetical protein
MLTAASFPRLFDPDRPDDCHSVANDLIFARIAPRRNRQCGSRCGDAEGGFSVKA